MKKSRFTSKNILGRSFNPSDKLQREISLVYNQLRRTKKLHEEQLLRLLRIECYVESELKEIELRLPPYSSNRYPELEKLQRRLFEIERDRRAVKLRLEDKVQELEDRMMSLSNKLANIFGAVACC